MECKSNGVSCTDCEYIAVFNYDEENRDSPDFIPLANMVRWRQKFRFFCSSVMGS